MDVKIGQCLWEWNISKLVNPTKVEKVAYKEGHWATFSQSLIIFLLFTRIIQFAYC
jgi:hypothetical protein